MLQPAVLAIPLNELASWTIREGRIQTKEGFRPRQTQDGNFKKTRKPNSTQSRALSR